MSKLYPSWTESEDSILKNTYPSRGGSECYALIPKRTRAAINTRIRELGLRRIGVKTGLEKNNVTEEWVVNKYRELKSKTAVANLLKMSPATILTILRKHGADQISHNVLDGRKEEVSADYLGHDLTFEEMCAKYKVSDTTMRSSIKRWGLIVAHRQITHKSMGGGWSKIRKNETYFDKIDTHEKAYWLGLIYADGYNGESPGWAFVLRLQKQDRELVEKLSMTLLNQVRLIEVPPQSHKCMGMVINGSGAFRLLVHSRHLSQSLTRAGAHRRKSQTLKFPSPAQVPSHLLSSFMLGYFDGDGCLTSSKRGVNKRKRYTFSLISTEQFCQEYQKVLNERLQIKACLHKQLKMTILTVGGNAQIERLMRWLYSNSPISLSRKKAIFEELCVYNKEYPKYIPYSKHKGVTFDKTKKTNLWIARIRIDGKDKTIGYASTEEEAIILKSNFLNQLEKASMSNV